MDEDITTVQVKVSTREKLRRLAKDNLRSMTAELEWIINHELARRSEDQRFQLADAGRQAIGQQLEVK